MMNLTTLQVRFVVLLITVLLVGGAGMALASHDPNIVHLCEKNDKLKVINDPAECGQNGTAIAIVTEQALADLQGANSDLQDQIDDLEMFIKRLNGYKAAVIERGPSGTAQGQPGHYVITLTFCESDGVTDCKVLQTGPVTEVDKGAVISFNASNSNDFQAIADRLTNGVDDFIMIADDYFDSDGNFQGGGSSSAPESSRFFRTPQVSTGPGFVDLAGLQIGSIDITVDSIQLFFNGTGTDHSMDYHVFFSLAD
jgi:hypothetical protein